VAAKSPADRDGYEATTRAVAWTKIVRAMVSGGDCSIDGAADRIKRVVYGGRLTEAQAAAVDAAVDIVRKETRP